MNIRSKFLLGALVAWAAACSDTDPDVDGNNGSGGNPTVGSGGAGVGSGGTNGPGTGSGGVGLGSGGGSSVDAGAGYVETGNWRGYAWTSSSGTGSTISPADFTGRPLGQPFPLCASGSVAAMEDYSGTAMVGINLNQGTGANDPIGTITPTGDGITVSVTNNGTSELRLQIQGPNGESDANDRWCASLPAGGGTVTWDEFNTKCWDGTGDAYDGQPLSSALILVPGGNVEAVPFDFCLNSLAEEGAVVIPGTGGSSGSGGASGSGGSSSGGSSGSGGSANFDGGHITFDSWKGYAWTYASGTGTITPRAFSVTRPPLCASGSVASGDANSAMLGINLNQVKGDNPPLGTIRPTEDGVLVNVTNRGNSPLRLQIQGPNGETSASDRWCAPLSAGESFIPWNAFTTTCWNSTGTAYNGQPLVSAIVLVPGSPTGTRSFDFCLNDLGEDDDPAGPGGQGCDLGGSPGTGSGTISAHSGEGSWAYVSSNRYVVQNNVWNGGGATHTLSYTGTSFTVTQQTGSQSTHGAPVSFPSVFIGSNYNRATTGSGMPKRVNQLNGVPTGWSWSHGNGGEYNATYDVYFSQNAGGDAGSPSGGFLMVWFHKPANAQPVGSSTAVVSLAGRNWNVWWGNQHEGKPVVSYVAQQSVTSLSFDLQDFIRDAVNRNYVQNTWYLTNIMAGFEIWSGGVNLKSNKFCAVVN